MSVDVGGLGWKMGSSDTILKGDHLRTIPSWFGPYWPSSFREEDLVPIGQAVSEKIFKTFFPKVPNVKIKSADVGCLGWPVGSSGTILKWDHLKTIQSNFGPNRLCSFREEDFKNFSHWVLC